MDHEPAEGLNDVDERIAFGGGSNVVEDGGRVGEVVIVEKGVVWLPMNQSRISAYFVLSTRRFHIENAVEYV